MNLFNWINKLMAFMSFGITGDEGGGAVDRGDDWTPTPDEDDKPESKAKDEAKDKPKEAAEDDETETEDEDEKDEKPEPKAKGKDSRLPLSRHKEILAKEREQRAALERELAAYKQGSQVAKTNADITKAENDVLAMEKEYLDLLAKGEVDKAAAKMAEIRRTERTIVQTNAALETQAAEARAYERVKYDTTVERLEAAYPQMNPDHDDYDKELTAELVEMRDGYVATGRYTRAEALQKACKLLLKTTTKRQEAAVDVDVRVDKDEVAKAAAAERKAAQVKKNLETAGKQPPSTLGVGQDSDKAGGKLTASDAIKMSQKDFAALSEADLKKLRGDDL